MMKLIFEILNFPSQICSFSSGQSSRLKSWILTATAVTLLTGCLEVAGDGTDFEIIPDITIECPGIICSSSATVFVGFIKDPSVDCEEYLANLDATNYNTSWDAKGSTTGTLGSAELTGSITSWTDPNSTAIGQLTNGQYKVCGHWDTNNNQFLDGGEATGEALIFLGNSPQFLDDWVNF